MRKNRLAATFLATLLTSLALLMLAHPVIAQPTKPTRVMTDDHGWRRIDTDFMTVWFPADGKKPMFLWNCTMDPEVIYVVKFEGLIEYFTFVEPFYKERYQAHAENLFEQFFKPAEREYEEIGGRENLQRLFGLIEDIYKKWHPPILPFRGCKWTLSEVEEITDPDGDEGIGYAFAFKLTDVPVPCFNFAKDNVMIKCRFYKQPVTETSVDGLYSYTVAAGEMKMDFVVSNWKWNIDIIKPLISVLHDEYEIDIPERQSRLALWINLASINNTRIREAWTRPEEIEFWSTCSCMTFDGRRTFIGSERTVEDARPWDARKRLHDCFRLQFATPDETLAGFFKFVASAKVTPEGEEPIEAEVRAAYIGTANHMRLFIGYPYFSGTLEHDPSIGVEIPETTAPEAITPKYTVEIPSGSQVMPRVIGRALPFVTPELVIALMVVASTIAIAVFAAKRKGKIVNVVGVK